MSQLKYKIRQSSIFKVLKSFKDQYQLVKWNLAGMPVPPPYFIKRKIIKAYAKKYRTPVFFETGSAAGDTIATVQSLFKKVFSVEINKNYFDNAKKRFAAKKNIEIINGDSGKVLASLLNDKINETTLFWLDGHYNSVLDPKGNELVCPIFGELDSIFNHPIKNHVILIDDARLFTGTNGYPTIDEVKITVATKRPDLLFYVEQDIIRMHKK
ncbi:MAG: hypothetical protein ABIT08_01865 [Bacteroidia bacterium]